MREQAARIMADWGFEMNADAPCGSLTVEQRQVVEITRALAAGTRCLLLDEPTAALERGACSTASASCATTAPAVVTGGRYRAPGTPGASTEIRPESLAEFAYPSGPAWRGGKI